jgi:hypothetical protein
MAKNFLYLEGKELVTFYNKVEKLDKKLASWLRKKCGIVVNVK